MTKASSSGCWRQFAGQNIAPISQQASEQLLEPERVLAEPGHPIAGSNPGVPQRVGAPVDPCRGLGPGQRAVAVGERDRGGPGTRVRAERIGQRAAIGRHRKNLSGATRAPDGRQCDGLRRFEDRRRPCTSLSLRATASLQPRLAVREGPARSLTLALHPARWVPAHWVPARWQSLPPDLASLPALRFLACPPGHPCLASLPCFLALPYQPARTSDLAVKGGACGVASVMPARRPWLQPHKPLLCAHPNCPLSVGRMELDGKFLTARAIGLRPGLRGARRALSRGGRRGSWSPRARRTSRVRTSAPDLDGLRRGSRRRCRRAGSRRCRGARRPPR